MSNWGWPQWAMLVILITKLAEHIITAVADSQATHGELVLEAAERKAKWPIRIASHTVDFLITLLILAKGGFWG